MSSYDLDSVIPGETRVRCICTRRCGGPTEGGKLISVRCRQRHVRQEPKKVPLSFKALRPRSSDAPLGIGATSPMESSTVKRRRLHSTTNADLEQDYADLVNEDRGVSSQSDDMDILELSGQGQRDNSDVHPPRIEPEDEPEDQRALDEVPDVGSIEDQRANSLPPSPCLPPVGHALPVPENTAEVGTFVPVIDDINISLKFIEHVKNASLEEYLDKDAIYQLRNPPEHELTLEDPDDRYSIDVFLAVTTASEATYNAIRLATLRRYPDSAMLTYHKVKQLVAELSGVVPILTDMCINSCIGYTGPFVDLECCPMCGQDRYDAEKASRKRFHTIPIGPQLQALWRSPESSDCMGYRRRYTERIREELRQHNGTRVSPYGDFFDGSDYLDAVAGNNITSDDMVLMFSIDGAQLYRNKASDCWIYIWVIMDHAPAVRYKKRYILPGGFIGGPNKPRNIDSYICVGLSHLAAIQKEGLKIWDASHQKVFVSRPFLAAVGADAVGLAPIAGTVGHNGKHGCRVYCPFVGRHKARGTHYYSARLKPANYSVAGCDHDDVKLNTLLAAHTSATSKTRYGTNLDILIRSPNQTQYEKRRLQTGLVGPSIFSGLPAKHMLGVPALFVLDIMHLPALNIPDLIIPLWRATIDCDKTDDKESWTWAALKDPAVWKSHGQSVADATPYIPGSFDRPPRNPAEKISSGYKAWEYLLYFFGLGPALLYGILPDPIWQNYCKVVQAFRILMQEEITPTELVESHQLMTEFSDGFEELYVQRRADRIHFVRPCVHTASHFAPETTRVGPGIIVSQWALERTIGNLGEEIKQHRDPYTNISERGVRRCQVNALKAIVPDLEPVDNSLPRGSEDLGSGFILLRARDRVDRKVSNPHELRAIRTYLERDGCILPESWEPRVRRWARVRLPNGQIARSSWKESLKPIDRLRISRNLKIIIGEKSYLVEAHYYMKLQDGDETKAVALVSFYGPPHEALYQASSKCYWTVQHLRDPSMRIIDIGCIQSVVCLAPDKQYAKFIQDGTEDDRWYMSEKPGLKLSQAVGRGQILTVG